MKKQKNKFFTFILSCIPGAGHMYIGFMKQGISLMGVSLLTIFIAVFFEIGYIMFAFPLVWAYSFFDAQNKNNASSEEFNLMEDRYLFLFDSFAIGEKNILLRYKIIFAIFLILFGFRILLSNMLSILYPYLSENIYYFIRHSIHYIPQLFLAVLVIFIGIKLIMGSKSNTKDTNVSLDLPLTKSDKEV